MFGRITKTIFGKKDANPKELKGSFNSKSFLDGASFLKLSQEEQNSFLQSITKDITSKVQSKNLLPEVEKQNIQNFLDKNENHYTQVLSDVLRKMKSEQDTLQRSEVVIDRHTRITVSPSYFAFSILFEGHNKESQYGFYYGPDTSGDLILENRLRIVPKELRGVGIARWFEKTIEKAARDNLIKEIYFNSDDTYAGITYALNQGYVVSKEENRIKVFDILKDLQHHVDQYNEHRKKDRIQFVKYLSI